MPYVNRVLENIQLFISSHVITDIVFAYGCIYTQHIFLNEAR